MPATEEGGTLASGPVPESASVFTVLREQLGLRLEAATAEQKILVIDHLEKPPQI